MAVGRVRLHRRRRLPPPLRRPPLPGLRRRLFPSRRLRCLPPSRLRHHLRRGIHGSITIIVTPRSICQSRPILLRQPSTAPRP
jgi:hypothetical protein